MAVAKIVCIHCRKPAVRLPQSRSGICLPCIGEHRRRRSIAVAAVSRAVRKGELPPAKACVCVDCGSQARDYDHRDYSRALDVQPTCRSCNLKRGPAVWGVPLNGEQPLKAGA